MSGKTSITVTVKGTSEGPDGVVHVIDEAYDNLTGLVFHGFQAILGEGKEVARALCVGGISHVKMVNILSAIRQYFGRKEFMIANMLLMSMGEDDSWETEVSIRQ